MKYVSEYRDGAAARRYLDLIARTATRRWALMEVCGGQTHTIVRYALDELLAAQVELIHGPGCPVCVTSAATLDHAIAMASQPGVILTSFGDMLRVPGSGRDLLTARAAGADVRIVYSPLDAVRLAAAEPGRQVVFFAVGFETTAPAAALAALEAERRRLRNFSLLVAHVRIPPAMEAILAEPDCRVQGFLAAGHVCSIMGVAEYEPLARRYRVPIVVTGFEPLDLLQGVAMAVRQLEDGRHEVENQYARAVRSAGNRAARRAMDQVFAVCDREWRGLGRIERGGLALRPEYAAFDAARRFPAAAPSAAEPEGCRAGLVLQGRMRPDACECFGGRCTPEHPLGAPMVSTEGACAAYHRYRRRVPAGTAS